MCAYHPIPNKIRYWIEQFFPIYGKSDPALTTPTLSDYTS